MKLRFIGVVSLMTLLLAAVIVVPAQGRAVARPVAQGTTGVPAEDSHLNTAPAADTYALWTPERMASAAPFPGTVVQGQPGSNVDLAQAVAPGPTQLMPGNAPGQNSRTATASDYAGIQPASVVTQYYTYPFPYDWAYMSGAWSHFFPERTNAKMYFTQNGTWYVASATVVSDGGAGVNRLVATCGACVRSSTGTWSDNVLICPAWSNGVGPWGCWAWSQMWNYNAWGLSGDVRADYGFVVTATTSTTGYGKIDSVIGSQGEMCNSAYVNEEWTFGYPSDSPFNGQYLVYNTSSTAVIDNFASLGTPYETGLGSVTPIDGAMGGGWVWNQRIAASGFVNGNNAYMYAAQPLAWYSPYQDCTDWKALYDSARVSNP